MNNKIFLAKSAKKNNKIFLAEFAEYAKDSFSQSTQSPQRRTIRYFSQSTQSKKSNELK